MEKKTEKRHITEQSNCMPLRLGLPVAYGYSTPTIQLRRWLFVFSVDTRWPASIIIITMTTTHHQQQQQQHMTSMQSDGVAHERMHSNKHPPLSVITYPSITIVYTQQCRQTDRQTHM